MRHTDSFLLLTTARHDDAGKLVFSKVTVTARHVLAARQHRTPTSNTRLLLEGGLHLDVWEYFYPNVQWMLYMSTRHRWVQNDRLAASEWASLQRAAEQPEWLDLLQPRVHVSDVLDAVARGEEAVFQLLREIGVLALEAQPSADDYSTLQPPSEAALREPAVVECEACRGTRGRPCAHCHGSGVISLIHSTHHGPGDVNDPVARECESSMPDPLPGDPSYTSIGRVHHA